MMDVIAHDVILLCTQIVYIFLINIYCVDIVKIDKHLSRYPRI